MSMETQQVTIISLAPVYQILATFFVAFIVIEYAKSYTMIIAKHIFNIDGIFQLYADKAKVDKTSILGELADERWKKDKGLIYSQKYQQEIEEYIETVDNASTDIQASKAVKFQFESFRYISIYMFIYCMSCLYVGGFFVNYSHTTEINYLMYESTISVIIVAIYFCIGHIQKLFNIFNRVTNFFVVMGLVILSFIISLLLTYKCPIVTEEIDTFSTIVELFAAFVPSLVFIVGFVFVYYKSYIVKNEIKTKYDALLTQRENLLDKLKNMKNYVDMGNEIENIEIEEQ